VKISETRSREIIRDVIKNRGSRVLHEQSSHCDFNTFPWIESEEDADGINLILNALGSSQTGDFIDMNIAWQRWVRENYKRSVYEVVVDHDTSRLRPVISELPHYEDVYCKWSSDDVSGRLGYDGQSSDGLISFIQSGGRIDSSRAQDLSDRWMAGYIEILSKQIASESDEDIICSSVRELGDEIESWAAHVRNDAKNIEDILDGYTTHQGFLDIANILYRTLGADVSSSKNDRSLDLIRTKLLLAVYASERQGTWEEIGSVAAGLTVGTAITYAVIISGGSAAAFGAGAAGTIETGSVLGLITSTGVRTQLGRLFTGQGFRALSASGQLGKIAQLLRGASFGTAALAAGGVAGLTTHESVKFATQKLKLCGRENAADYLVAMSNEDAMNNLKNDILGQYDPDKTTAGGFSHVGTAKKIQSAIVSLIDGVIAGETGSSVFRSFRDNSGRAGWDAIKTRSYDLNESFNYDRVRESIKKIINEIGVQGSTTSDLERDDASVTDEPELEDSTGSRQPAGISDTQRAEEYTPVTTLEFNTLYMSHNPGNEDDTSWIIRDNRSIYKITGSGYETNTQRFSQDDKSWEGEKNSLVSDLNDRYLEKIAGITSFDRWDERIQPGIFQHEEREAVTAIDRGKLYQTLDDKHRWLLTSDNTIIAGIFRPAGNEWIYSKFIESGEISKYRNAHSLLSNEINNPGMFEIEGAETIINNIDSYRTINPVEELAAEEPVEDDSVLSAIQTASDSQLPSPGFARRASIEGPGGEKRQIRRGGRYRRWVIPVPRRPIFDFGPGSGEKRVKEITISGPPEAWESGWESRSLRDKIITVNVEREIRTRSISNTHRLRGEIESFIRQNSGKFEAR